MLFQINLWLSISALLSKFDLRERLLLLVVSAMMKNSHPEIRPSRPLTTIPELASLVPRRADRFVNGIKLLAKNLVLLNVLAVIMIVTMTVMTTV